MGAGEPCGSDGGERCGWKMGAPRSKAELATGGLDTAAVVAEALERAPGPRSVLGVREGDPPPGEVGWWADSAEDVEGES